MILQERVIHPEMTIVESLKRMDQVDKKLLLVLDNEKFVGLLSSGDLQRAIIENQPLNTKISKVLRTDIKIAHEGDSFSDIKEMMISFRMEFCPVLNSENEIINIHYWEDIFDQQKIRPLMNFDLPVVIMAGGFGTRLRPITHVLPKPLVPITDRTMLEEIFARFARYGSDTFFLSVNYKAELIKYYISQLGLDYDISYIQETKPMGTAGSLKLLEGDITSTFFVTNCDILVEQDYSEILKYHYDQQNSITIVGAVKQYEIPYGTLETGENGSLKEIVEKPDLTFLINSGMYILEPEMLRLIPQSELFHITHLIDKAVQLGERVGVFPVSEGSWRDMGELHNYIELLRDET